MPTLLEYINQLQREHRYRIKMAFQPTDNQLEVLERHMKKYDALEVARPEKLMLQARPMDFPQLGGHEIVIVDTVTRLPVSPPVLEAELRGLFFIADGLLKVFGRDEPLEQQIEAETEESAEAKVGTDYTDAEANAVAANDVAGDEYNKKMLATAKGASKGEITSGPEYDAPADGKASPLTSVDNPMPVAKGTKK